MLRVLDRTLRYSPSQIFRQPPAAFAGQCRCAWEAANNFSKAGQNFNKGHDSAEFADIVVNFPICITNLNRRVFKKDVKEFLEANGCHIDVRYIRLEFSASLQPAAWWASMPSPEDQAKAIELSGSYLGTRKVQITAGDPAVMRKAVMNPMAMHSKGRFVYLTGIQANVSVEDIKRFFHGFDMMAHPVTLLRSQAPNGHLSAPAGLPIYSPDLHRAEPHAKAICRFTSTEEAHRAVRERSGEPLLNTRALLRVLE